MKHKTILPFILGVLLFIPSAVMAEVSISIGIPLPPFIFLQPAPVIIIVPGTTDVYAVSGSDEDIFFWDDWWWWFWDGHWYRSHKYDAGWAPYDHAPEFYGKLDHNWRDSYNHSQDSVNSNSFDVRSYNSQQGGSGGFVNDMINLYNNSGFVRSGGGGGNGYFMGNGGGGGGSMGQWGGRR